MKRRILLSLILLFSATYVSKAQVDADDNVDVDAEIVAAITIAINTHMNFGKLVRVDSTAATTDVVLAAATGAVTGSADITPISGTTTTAAEITVTGDANATFSITIPGSVNLTRNGGTETIALGTFTFDNAAATANTLPSGTRTFDVGATLTIGGPVAAPPGLYEGDFNVKVEYE